LTGMIVGFSSEKGLKLAQTYAHKVGQTLLAVSLASDCSTPRMVNGACLQAFTQLFARPTLAISGTVVKAAPSGNKLNSVKSFCTVRP